MKQFASFRLDPADGCLWRQGQDGRDQRVSLELKTFAVLSYLVENAGRLIAQEEIIDAVWPDSVVQPEVLKRHISLIRDSLGDNPKQPTYIETLPRRGYRFLVPALAPGADYVAEDRSGSSNRIVGRDQVLAELESCVQRARAGRRQIVFVTGEAGIGKTTLADELERRAPRSGVCRTARGQCIEGFGGREAYYPVLGALEGLCGCDGGESVVRILTSHAPTWLIQFPSLIPRTHRQQLHRETLGATRERMLRELVRALEMISTRAPLLLLLEDLHWADHSTIDALSALARGRTPARLLILGTCRPSEGSAADQPLARVIHELVVHGLAAELALSRLGINDIEAYLGVGHSNPPGVTPLAHILYRYSEGNPLFMVAALEHMTQRGMVSREEGRCRLSVPLPETEIQIPQNILALIEAQINRLSREEQRVLEAASVVGVTFTTGVIAAAAQMDETAIEEICGDLSRRKSMIHRRAPGEQTNLTGSEHHEFSHTLYREVFYSRQPAGRRAKTHRRIGEYLEARHAADLGQVATELAHHFRACGDWPRVTTYLKVAAERATRLQAHPQAAELLREALAVVDKLPEQQRATDRVALLERLAMTYTGGYDERAIETYRQVAQLAAQPGLVAVQIRALLGVAFPLSCVDAKQCIQALDRALELTADQHDTVTRAHIRASVYFHRIWTRGWDPADYEAFRTAFEELQRSGDRSLIAYHRVEKSQLEWASARYLEAMRDTAEGFNALTADPAPNSGINLSLAHWGYRLQVVWNPLLAGQWGEALREAREGISVMERNADCYCAQTLRLYQAWIHLFACDYPTALEICKSAFETDHASVPGVRRELLAPLAAELRIALIIIGSAQVGMRQFQQARSSLRRAQEDMERREVIFGWYWKMPLEVALTDLAIAEGHWDEARVSTRRLHTIAQGTEERSWQALAWHGLARVALEDRDIDRARLYIEQALNLVETRELPIAAWRVHALATDIAHARGDEPGARRHRDLACSRVQALAESFPRDEPLRATFISAPAVAALIGHS